MRRHPEYRLAAIATWEQNAASVKGGGIMACWPCTTPVAWDLHCTSARTNPARARDALPASNASGFHKVFWIEFAIYVWSGDEKIICARVPDNNIIHVPGPFNRYQDAITKVVRYDESRGKGVCA